MLTSFTHDQLRDSGLRWREMAGSNMAASRNTIAVVGVRALYGTGVVFNWKRGKQSRRKLRLDMIC